MSLNPIDSKENQHGCRGGQECECDEGCECQEDWRVCAPPDSARKIQAQVLERMGVGPIDTFAVTLPADIPSMAAKLRDLLTTEQLAELGSCLFPGFPGGIPIAINQAKRTREIIQARFNQLNQDLENLIRYFDEGFIVKVAMDSNNSTKVTKA